MLIHYRHGDLLLVEVNHIPEDAKRSESLVLEEGEVTGHAHRLAKVAGVMLYLNELSKYVKNDVNVDITHEEHNTITLPPGLWEVRRQKEYTPAGWRQVQD